MVYILDASVAIKWFVQEKGQDQALEIFKNVLEAPEKYAVPELFYFELSHVFNRIIPSPNSDQLFLLDQVLKLAVHRFSMTRELYQEIRRFQHMGLSGYDAAYVALAKILKGLWLSFDKKAHHKIAHLKLSRLII